MTFWLGREACIVLPENESLLYQRLPENRLNAQERIEALGKIISIRSNDAQPVIILTAKTLAAKTVEHGKFVDCWINIKTGQQIDPIIIIQHLQKIGYNIESMVNVPGTISRRGGIIDVFPVGKDKPVTH